jgi:hypothetical protein
MDNREVFDILGCLGIELDNIGLPEKKQVNGSDSPKRGARIT